MSSESIILIVDDDPIGRSASHALLSRGGYRLELAQDGPSALRMAASIRPDLILLDVMMPGMDGYEVTRRLRADPQLAEVPILLVTALDDPVARLAGLEAGADDFITKPFDRIELRARIRTITRLNRFRRLTEQRERYQRLFEQAPCGLMVIDTTTQVLEANPIATRLLDQWLPKDTPRKLSAILTVEQSIQFDRMLSTAWNQSLETPHAEFTIRVGEATICFDLSICSLRSDDAGLFQVVLNDRTTQRQLEEELRLAQRLESVGQLAGGIAHDFNNLLTVINGFSSLALDRLPSGDPNRELVEEVFHAGERAADLTRHLLAFGRRSVLNPTAINLGVLIQRVEKMLGRLIGTHIQIRTGADANGARVWADAGQVEQVLFNLAANARDAMPGGGTLALNTSLWTDPEATATNPRQWVRLTVEDTGCGMTPEVQARIFEPFFTTKEVGKGTGLGMATVYGIVRQSGGRIQVQSTLGVGTRFVIDFPLFEDHESSLLPDSRAAQLAGGTETILLAEDDPGVRGFAEAALAAAGYQVLVARDGEEALQHSAQQDGPIHLLFTDSVMPKMSGRELAERLRQSRPTLRVLHTSGYDPEASGNLPEGTTGFVQKPYTVSRLLQAIREALDR